MTNSEKYKTARERFRAFRDFCAKRSCYYCRLCRDENDEYIGCEFQWLDLEAEEDSDEKQG